MTNYKKYSLGQVENFLYDAMSSGATPQEIYDTIRGVVEDNYYTYKKCASEAYELLALLNGNGKGHIQAYDEYLEKGKNLQYTEEELNAMCDAATSAKKGKVNKWVLPVEEVDCDECIINLPDDLLEAANLKEGDEVEWVDNGDGSYLMKKVTKKEN